MNSSLNEDLFKPLTAQEKDISLSLLPKYIKCADISKADDWQPWEYPPDESTREYNDGAKPFPFPHAWKGYEFKAWYPYRDENGEVLYFVVRMEDQQGKKVTPALSYGVKDGKQGWHWKSPTQRILFNLDELAAFPPEQYGEASRVLVVEGEKTVLAAKKIFTDRTITTSGGSHTASCVDWSPLAGREVFICPDNDEAGFKYAQAVKTNVLEAGAKSAALLMPPKHFPKGWDLADPISQAFFQEVNQ